MGKVFQKENTLLKSEKLEIVGELAGCLAHEIRNPLTSMKGFIQLLEGGSFKQDYFEEIYTACSQIEQYINDLLLLSKSQPINKSLVNMKSLIEVAIDEVRDKTKHKSIHFHQEYDLADLPLASCDPTQISKVIYHLISNGIEAIPSEGVITINVMKEEYNLVIKISDNGVGMSQERLEKLGEPHFCTKEKGTGFGLMLCYKIIEQHHNGTILVESEENKGTTVELRLPI